MMNSEVQNFEIYKPQPAITECDSSSKQCCVDKPKFNASNNSSELSNPCPREAKKEDENISPLENMSFSPQRKRVYCQYQDCNRQASFGSLGSPPSWCSKHKNSNSLNLSSRVCQEDGCQVTANYGYLGERPKFCSTHQKVDMVNRNRIKTKKACMQKLNKMKQMEQKIKKPLLNKNRVLRPISISNRSNNTTPLSPIRRSTRLRECKSKKSTSPFDFSYDASPEFYIDYESKRLNLCEKCRAPLSTKKMLDFGGKNDCIDSLFKDHKKDYKRIVQKVRVSESNNQNYDKKFNNFYAYASPTSHPDLTPFESTQRQKYPLLSDLKKEIFKTPEKYDTITSIIEGAKLSDKLHLLLVASALITSDDECLSSVERIIDSAQI